MSTIVETIQWHPFYTFPSNNKTIKHLQCMSAETIFESYAKPFVVSQNPENPISAKLTVSYL